MTPFPQNLTHDFGDYWLSYYYEFILSLKNMTFTPQPKHHTLYYIVYMYINIYQNCGKATLTLAFCWINSFV